LRNDAGDELEIEWGVWKLDCEGRDYECKWRVLDEVEDVIEWE
jgi:hypothetical protein